MLQETKLNKEEVIKLEKILSCWNINLQLVTKFTLNVLNSNNFRFFFSKCFLLGAFQPLTFQVVIFMLSWEGSSPSLV